MTVATEGVQATWSGQEEMARMEELGEKLRRHAGDLAAAEYRWLVLLEEFDRGDGWAQQGARTCAQWLSWACGLGLEAARERLRVAKTLPALPTVSAAFSAGRLSYSKVRAITRIATPDNEALLTVYGLSATAAQVEEIVRSHRRALLASDDEVQSGHERRMLRSTTLPDGRVRITVEYPPEQAAALLAKVEAHAERLGEPVAPPSVPDERRSPEQLRALAEAGAPEAPLATPVWEAPEPIATRRADSLLRLVQAAGLDDGPADDDRVRVILHIRHDPTPTSHPADNPAAAGAAAQADATVPGPDEVPEPDQVLGFDRITETARKAAEDLEAQGSGCSLEDGTVLAAETARRLACDAEILTMVEDALGNPVGIARRARTIPRRLRRALRHRDGGCRFPGCTARRWVDAHHVIFWSQGGPTEMGNLVLLCRHHHRLVHEAGYRIRTHPGQRFSFHRPDGTLVPGCPPPTDGDAAAPAQANRAAGITVDPDTIVPEWDGRRPDYSLAVGLLWDTTFPDDDPTAPEAPERPGHPAGEDVSAVPPAASIAR